MHSNALAVVFALLSALTIAWGTVLRHQTAEQTSGDPDDAHRSPLLAAVMRPKWWGGLLCAATGYALQIVALGFGTLLVVQPILVLSLMFTLPLSAKFDGRRVSRPEMFWAGLLTVAVGVLVIMGRPLPGRSVPDLDAWIIALGVGVVGLAAVCWAAGRRPDNQKALLLGLVTGAVMGYVAVLSKAVVDIFTTDGVHGLVTSWEIYGLITGATVGTGIQQLSFNAGALKNSLPAMTIAEPVVAFILGYTLLGEKFQVHGTGWLVMAAALAAMIVGTVVLSRRGVD
ncbi:DMT family transporter [Corynebacterium provencense]|uniref:DMT family transporter n=1 Tax=Corynebacterium provencense TaxID=1737425 RepID=UPI00082DE440|nr:DMT family transporter [Corynebacterium provencense]MCI1255499.1 DMT family transporter [Corynebacterium provencense]